MRRNFLKFLTITLAVGLVGCPPKNESAGGGGGNAATSGGDILIGEYGSLTGAQATFDQSTSEEASTAVTKLISQNGVLAMLGEVASSNSIAGADVCQSNKVPMITPSSTNPQVTKKGDYIFRVCFTDDYQGHSLGEYVAKTLGVKRAAILTDVKSDYSQGLGHFFEERFTALGGKIVAKASYANGDSDFKSQL